MEDGPGVQVIPQLILGIVPPGLQLVRQIPHRAELFLEFRRQGSKAAFFVQEGPELRDHAFRSSINFTMSS